MTTVNATAARNAQRIRNHKKRERYLMLTGLSTGHKESSLKIKLSSAPTALIACLTKQKIHTHIHTHNCSNANKIRNAQEGIKAGNTDPFIAAVCVFFVV